MEQFEPRLCPSFFSPSTIESTKSQSCILLYFKVIGRSRNQASMSSHTISRLVFDSTNVCLVDFTKGSNRSEGLKVHRCKRLESEPRQHFGSRCCGFADQLAHPVRWGLMIVDPGSVGMISRPHHFVCPHRLKRRFV